MLKLYRQVDDQDGLERTLKALIDLRRNRPQYRELLGQLYAEQARYEEAIPLFETLLQERPSDPRLLSRLKMLYTQTGQVKKAETVGAAASETAAPSQLVARARSLYERVPSADTASVRSATDLLHRALDTAPMQVEALDLLGTIYFDQGRYAAAAPLFQRAIDTNPRDPNRWRHAAAAHLRADSARQAAALAEEGRLLFPGRYDLTRVEAFARLRLGEHEVARARFQEALAWMDSTAVPASEHAELRAGLALAHQHLGHRQKAHAAYESALRTDPRSALALRHYAYSLAQQGDQLDRALTLAQRAVEVEGPTPEALDTLGWVYFKRENYAEAQAAFEEALSAGTVPARLYEHFGDVQSALGNESEARTYWQKALDRDPDRASVKQKLDSSPQS
jgi:tetratricopeptide (TPR) repeat protein